MSSDLVIVTEIGEKHHYRPGTTGPEWIEWLAYSDLLPSSCARSSAPNWVVAPVEEDCDW